MAIVACGRCGKGYSDKVSEICPDCGGTPASAPRRPDFVAPRGLAPGTPVDRGSPASPGLVLAGIVALGLIGFGLIKAFVSSRPSEPEAVAAAPRPAPGGPAASSWADRVEAAVRSMSIGQDGANLAGGAVRCLHGSVQRAYVSGSSVARVGKDASVSLSFTWFDQKGTPCQTGVTWYLSEQRGHVRAAVSTDSSAEQAVYGGDRALNRYFRGPVYSTLVGRMSGQAEQIGPTSTEITVPAPDTRFAPAPATPAPAPEPPRRRRRR